jgi:hypothetical protein
VTEFSGVPAYTPLFEGQRGNQFLTRSFDVYQLPIECATFFTGQLFRKVETYLHNTAPNLIVKHHSDIASVQRKAPNRRPGPLMQDVPTRAIGPLSLCPAGQSFR